MAMKYQLTPDKKILIIIVFLVILTFLITIIVLISQNKTTAPIETPPIGKEEINEHPGISTTDFIFPKYIETSELKEFYPFREKRKAWSDEEISQYWIPVRKLLLTAIKNEESKKIRQILGNNN